MDQCGKWLLALSCLSVNEEHFSSHGTHFCEVLYWVFLQKFFDEIQFWLKSVQNNVLYMMVYLHL